jgi:hypothetical protein
MSFEAGRPVAERQIRDRWIGVIDSFDAYWPTVHGSL